MIQRVARELWLAVLLAAVGIGAAQAQTVIYIHTDVLGSVVAKSDASGKVIKRYDYESYAAVVGGDVDDGPGFTGHVSDASTGLSYMQQRYADGTFKTFLDPKK